jgi:hypothetical protein
MTQDKPCSDTVQPGVGRTVDDLVTWLRTVPGLIATAPTAITIDGHPGQWLDLRHNPTWTKTCEGSTEPLVTFLNPGIAVGADQRVRLILLDLGDGDVVATGIWTRDQATLDTFVTGGDAGHRIVQVRVALPTIAGGRPSGPVAALG